MAEAMDNWQKINGKDMVNKLIIEGHLADCTFIIGPENETTETIYGHKIVFIMHSPVFEKMFSEKYKEGQESKVRLTDVCPNNFKNLCYIIYTNSASILNSFSFDELLCLYRLCDKFIITSVSKLCYKEFTNSKYLSLENLTAIFELSLTIDDQKLSKVTRNLITNNYRRLRTVRTDLLNDEQFYEYLKSKNNASYFSGFLKNSLEGSSYINRFTFSENNK